MTPLSTEDEVVELALAEYRKKLRVSDQGIIGSEKDFRAGFRAASLLRAPEAPGWQKIETAPKDRKILLGKIVGHPDHPTALWWACSGAWSERFKNWNDGVEPSGLSGPTHWAEFPAMPTWKGDARICTCHPSEAPEPCQQKFALQDCLAAAKGKL
jgi:hypothetical protein